MNKAEMLETETLKSIHGFPLVPCGKDLVTSKLLSSVDIIKSVMPGMNRTAGNKKDL